MTCLRKTVYGFQINLHDPYARAPFYTQRHDYPKCTNCNNKHHQFPTNIFKRNDEVPILTASMLRDLLDIFIFFQQNHVAPKGDMKENFIIWEGKLLVARPWELEENVDGLMLPKTQEDVGKMFRFSSLSVGEKDCPTRFFLGTSPGKLLGHPVFWTIDRRKCFLMDLAP